MKTLGSIEITGARGAALAAVLASVAAAAPAAAQTFYDRSGPISVTARGHPEYDALGVNLGGFTLFPRLSLSTVYDDNIFAVPTKTSGAFLVMAPTLDFDSNWNRNLLDVQLRYERDQYLEQTSESSDEYSLTTNGRVDIDRASALTFNATVGRLTESRTDPDTVEGLLQPVRYDNITLSGSGYREFGRLRLDLTLSDAYYSFFNAPLVGGGVYNEESRDENATTEQVRMSWAVDPNVALFVQVAPNQSNFLHRPFNGLSSYDSTGYQILGGVNAQVTHLIRADVGFGYLNQTYNDRSIPNVTGAAYNANVIYDITPLITLTGSANHSVAASGIPGTPASNVDTESLRADYEFRRNIIISPNLSYSQLQYPGTTRTDDRINAGLNATYLINRNFGLTASYAYLQQRSRGGFGGYNFNDSRLSLSLTAQR